MSKERKIDSNFIPVRYEWLKLIGYPCPVINQDGNVSIKGGIPQTKAIDYIDILLLSEISGYRELGNQERDCFASPATLAAAVGLCEPESDMEVVKRIARYAASGIVTVFHKSVMGQSVPQTIYRVNVNRIDELSKYMEEERSSRKVEPTPAQKILRASKVSEKLLYYIQNYVQDYSPDHNQTNQKTTEKTNQQTIYETGYETLHQTNQIDGKPVEREDFPQSEDACMRNQNRDAEREEAAETNVSVSSIERKDPLPPWVDGGFASVRDIFEHGVNPMLSRGWSYRDIDNIVEEITGTRQKIKDISNPADRQAVYEKLVLLVESGDVPEIKKKRKEESIVESGKTAEIFEIAHKMIDEYDWEWSDINEFIEKITGKQQSIKEIETEEERQKVAEHFKQEYKTWCDGASPYQLWQKSLENHV